MAGPDIYTRTASIWLRDAEEDLATAQDMLGLPRAQPRPIAFFAQQAAEKALKGAATFSRTTSDGS